MGATVLHEEAIFPVRKEGIPINIRNTNAPEDKGTLIVESTCRKPEYTITGIAGKKGFAALNIEKDMMNSEVGFGRKVLEVFEKNGISFEHMPSGIDTMTVFVHQSEFEGEGTESSGRYSSGSQPGFYRAGVGSGPDRCGGTRHAFQPRHGRTYFLCPGPRER